MSSHYIAVDLGAESGRVILGSLQGGRLEIEEVHRFANGPLVVGGTMRWDVLHLFAEMKEGIRKVAAMGLPIASISTDSWGVDYVYVRDGEPMLTVPFHYRDGRNAESMKRVLGRVSADEIFAETGIQFLDFNTLFQLCADKERRPWVFESCDQFLPIADYYNYLFSGVGRCEVSLASTTQLLHPVAKRWSWELVEKLGLPKGIFPELIGSGSVLGLLLPELAEELGIGGAPQVVAGLSHDTGAAVAAVPGGALDGDGDGKRWAYISSGTWSLLGMECDAPIINAKSREYNFTNEAGYGGTTRFLKNIVGLWIVQECRREWEKGGVSYEYAELVRLAEDAKPFGSLIDPRDPRFVKPGKMVEKVVEYCRQTGQQVPEGPGAIVRCVLESLALLYAGVLKQMEEASSRQFGRIHIVGGGCKNRLLNQFTAGATGLEVVAGPAEATAAGNILVQALALGHLGSLEEVREVVRGSFALEVFEAGDRSLWEEAGRRFRGLGRVD